MSPKEKEEQVRKALGVEKKYVVTLTIPTTGETTTNGIAIMAIDKEEAIEKAKELILKSSGVDINNTEPEEVNHYYDYNADTNNWEANVTEEV